MANNVSSQRGTFTNSYPVVVEHQNNIDNQAVEDIIRSVGDQDGQRTRAKCYRTQWDMHEVSAEIRKIGTTAIEVAHKHPLAGRSSPDGTPEEISYGIRECWGLIYKQSEETRSHSHWPSTWAFVYNVKSCPKCSPLILPSNGLHPDTKIYPVVEKLTLFPAWLNHEVPYQPCDHERIIVAGNLDIEWRVNWDTKTLETNRDTGRVWNRWNTRQIDTAHRWDANDRPKDQRRRGEKNTK